MTKCTGNQISDQHLHSDINCLKKSIFWTGESDIDGSQQRARSFNRERQELKACHKLWSWAYQKFNYQGIWRASGLHSGLLTGSWYSFKSWTRAQLKSHSSEFSFFTKQVCFDKHYFSALRPTCGFFKLISLYKRVKTPNITIIRLFLCIKCPIERFLCQFFT